MGGSPAAMFVPPSADIKKFRLIVTGHDDEGQSVFLTDQIAPHVMTVLQTPTYAVTDFWKALTLPADNCTATAKDPCRVPFVVAPPAGGIGAINGPGDDQANGEYNISENPEGN